MKFNAYLTSVKGGYFNSACPLIVILCDYSYCFADIFFTLCKPLKIGCAPFYQLAHWSLFSVISIDYQGNGGKK